MSYIPHQGKPPQPQSQHPAHSRGQQQSSIHYTCDDFGQRRQATYNQVPGRQVRPNQSASPGAPPLNHTHDMSKGAVSGRPSVTPPPSQPGQMSNPIPPNAGQVVGQPQMPMMYAQPPSRPVYGMRMQPQRQQSAQSAGLNYNHGQIMQAHNTHAPQPRFIQPVLQSHGLNLQYRSQYQYPQPMATYAQPGTQPYYPAAQPNLQASYIQNQPIAQAPTPLSMYQPQPRPQPTQATYTKPRTRTIITIVDPTTNIDITDSIIGEASKATSQQMIVPGTASTPPMSTATPPPQPPQEDSNQAIQAAFAAEVARRAMAPEDEGRRDPVYVKPLVRTTHPVTILPRQDQSRSLKIATVEPNQPALVVAPISVQTKLDKTDLSIQDKITDDATKKQIVEVDSDVKAVLIKPVILSLESVDDIKLSHVTVELDNVSSVPPSTTAVHSNDIAIPTQPEATTVQPASSVPTTSTVSTTIVTTANEAESTDSLQARERKRNNQKKRIYELDRKPVKDDDMFSAYRTEEEHKEEQSVTELEETPNMPELNKETEIQEKLTDSSIETQEKLTDSNIETQEKLPDSNIETKKKKVPTATLR